MINLFNKQPKTKFQRNNFRGVRINSFPELIKDTILYMGTKVLCKKLYQKSINHNSSPNLHMEVREKREKVEERTDKEKHAVVAGDSSNENAKQPGKPTGNSEGEREPQNAGPNNGNYDIS